MTIRDDIRVKLKDAITLSLESKEHAGVRPWLNPSLYKKKIKFDSDFESEEILLKVPFFVKENCLELFDYTEKDFFNLSEELSEKIFDYFLEKIMSLESNHISFVEYDFDIKIGYRFVTVYYRYSFIPW